MVANASFGKSVGSDQKYVLPPFSSPCCPGFRVSSFFGSTHTSISFKDAGRFQKTADRLAGYLVYFALGAAVLTFLITHNLRSTISVIIVAGACGIAAGTPLAILGAIGRAARKGAIIKGGIYLEALGQLDTVFLDKTGDLDLWLSAGHGGPHSGRRV